MMWMAIDLLSTWFPPLRRGIQSALEGIVPDDHIVGTEFRYDPATGEIQSILRVPAGYGKVAVLDDLRATLPLSHDRIVYVGDGSSDVHVICM